MGDRTSAGPVDVATMPDTENDDLTLAVIDAVEDSIRAAPSAPDSLELVPQLGANTMRVIEQRPRDEFDDGKRNSIRQRLLDGACGDTPPARRRPDACLGVALVRGPSRAHLRSL